MKLDTNIRNEKQDSKVKTVYHASKQIVENPIWNYIPEDSTLEEQSKKDFGLGFYTCIEPEYPIGLYCEYDTVYVNKYELNLDGLTPEPSYLVNDRKWLLITAAHRDNFSRFKKWHDLRDQIRGAIKSQNIIVGAISNDRFFSAFERFLAGGYTDEFTIKIIQLLNYPEQYVLKSGEACANIQFISQETVPMDILIEHR